LPTVWAEQHMLRRRRRRGARHVVLLGKASMKAGERLHAVRAPQCLEELGSTQPFPARVISPHAVHRDHVPAAVHGPIFEVATGNSIKNGGPCVCPRGCTGPVKGQPTRDAQDLPIDLFLRPFHCSRPCVPSVRTRVWPRHRDYQGTQLLLYGNPCESQTSPHPQWASMLAPKRGWNSYPCLRLTCPDSHTSRGRSLDQRFHAHCYASQGLAQCSCQPAPLRCFSIGRGGAAANF
jgi:hypothetical protein